MNSYEVRDVKVIREEERTVENAAISMVKSMPEALRKAFFGHMLNDIHDTQRVISQYYKSLPYGEYLLTSRWAELSSRVRSGKSCKYCGSKERIQCHHVEYGRLGELYEARDIIPLCDYCHRCVERSKDLIRATYGERFYRIEDALETEIDIRKKVADNIARLMIKIKDRGFAVGEFSGFCHTYYNSVKSSVGLLEYQFVQRKGEEITHLVSVKRKEILSERRIAV